jgi:glycine dehydrogenase subunit 2
VPSTSEGYVDTEKLKEVVGDDTAGLMITNPNTVGLFEKNITEIAKIIHGAGGLLYYDGANLNAIMGIVRPGDMGFDVIHLNLHKTFSTPHGGGGPGSGPVGCKERLSKFLPVPYYKKNGTYSFDYDLPESIGRMKAFYGNFLVVVRALAYIETLGHEGILEASENAVLNANYLMSKLSDLYDVAYTEPCMHEFVLSIEELKKNHGVTAMDIAKSLLDYGMHPPTMYFPMIVHEALMIEPTETESIDVLDEAAEIFRQIYQTAVENPETVRNAPYITTVARLDEVNAARNPKLKFLFTE